MNYAKACAQPPQALKQEGRYRVFADICRTHRRFPAARHYTTRRQLTPTPLHCDADMRRLIFALRTVWIETGFQHEC